jgi:subtilisin family serine protease
MPNRKMGAPQFVAQHRTFDGRGVTVALVDTNIDLLLPELQTAKSLDGQPARKVADIVTSVPDTLDASDDEGDLATYLKIDMREEVATSGGKINYKGVIYDVPTDGRYRVGLIDERLKSPQGDLNRDGNPAGSSGLFAVLCDEQTNTVRVDTNQNHSFADEKAMTDYRVRSDVGTFGKDNPTTARRETVGFAVQIDPKHKLVLILPGYGSHGTHVAGAAFGKAFFGGQVNGVAPEAQIVSVPFVDTAHSLVESLITAVKHPRVDIVTIDAVYIRALNDGGSTLAIICDRLIDKYKKPIFASAGNAGDEVNVVFEAASASRVIAVGSYINRETSRVNYGVATVREDNIDILSARGPSKDGGFKPNLLRRV